MSFGFFYTRYKDNAEYNCNCNGELGNTAVNVEFTMVKMLQHYHRNDNNDSNTVKVGKNSYSNYCHSHNTAVDVMLPFFNDFLADGS